MVKMWIIGLGLVIGLLCGCGNVSTVTPSTLNQEQMPLATELRLTEPSAATTLIPEKLISYDGPYGEDRSGDMVTGIAGLLLYNPTNRMIEFGVFALRQGTQQLYFAVSQLPPMSRCLVLEKTRKPYQDGEFGEFRELTVRWSYQQMSRQQLDYLGYGSRMTIINREERAQEQVIVRYKRYNKEGDFYLGGEAYSVYFMQLQSGESRTVVPEHYNAATAKIVAIEAK